MIRAFQWDVARQVERLDVLLDLLPRYAEWGYHELYLHLEDAVHYPSLPGVGRDDAYTYEQLGELVLAAARAGIRVVPIANLLGHTQYLIRQTEWRDLNELRDERDRPLERGQICPLHPRLPEVAARLLQDLAPYCTAGKIHVGLDESFHLGRCPRCRAEVERIGLGAHFAGHVGRLRDLAHEHGLQLGIWADMLYFVPEAIPLLPRGIAAYDWYYYPFAGAPRVEFFNFAPRDLQPALRRREIDYYGCPMNGAFRSEPLPVFGDRLANIRSWWQRCQAVGAAGMLVTSWESYRLALETTTVVDAAAAGLWLDPEPHDATSLLAGGLARRYRPAKARELARTLLAADEHAFTGYARWEINDRWDAAAGTEEGLAAYEAESRFFDRATSGALRWPAAFAASLAFRRYLAQRDVFVRQAARNVFRLRRRLARQPAGARDGGEEVSGLLTEMRRDAAAFASDLRAGRRAARAMWVRTRDPGARGQNERILEADEERLRSWVAWLRRAARRRAETIRQATPVCGAWQLQFVVHNPAPAAQLVVVEQQDANGRWSELARRFTIEFRAAAARPVTKIRHEFTVPVAGPDARLRIAVRGVGQVAISHAALTDGVVTRRSRDFHAKRMLGKKAPSRGLPTPEWERNVAEMIPRWE
jgi:hypothetical protein